MGSSSDDDDVDIEKDLELNRKVATVMQPLMKKLRKQAKRIEHLEELASKTGTDVNARVPLIEEAVRELTANLEDAMERTRRDLGERVLHTDHARVEVSAMEGLRVMQLEVEDARSRAVASELLAKQLQQRLDESEAAGKRVEERVEERAATMRAAIADEGARADSRRSELQLHMQEMSARLHAEVVEVKRATERELQKLDATIHMAAKRTDVTERFAGVDESMISASARTDRLSAQLSALEGTVAEVQANLRLRATASELSQLRGAVEGILSSGDKGGVASTEMVAELARDMASREQAWERRHRAVELSATSSMREVRQMAANIDELGGRLGSFALQEEVHADVHACTCMHMHAHACVLPCTRRAR